MAARASSPASISVHSWPNPKDLPASSPRLVNRAHLPYDLRVPQEAWERRRADGKALRAKVPREKHAAHTSAKDRPNPLDLIAASNVGRLKDFIPLRMGRMAASPFGFLRGSAVVMAWDLSRTTVSGIPVIMAGDAHLSNFGLFGTPLRDIIFDLNDFDESTIGPWEWDLKRLVASVNVAGRENGLNRPERRAAALRCVAGYRFNITRLQSMGVLDVWYLHAYPGRDNLLGRVDPKSHAVIRKSIAKAMQQTNATLLEKTAERLISGAWRFREDPPVLTRVDRKTREDVIKALNAYGNTLTLERRYMLSRYHAVDVVHRVVGVGSVGTRAYLVLLFGNGDDDPLFLQGKEATVPAHAPFVTNRLEEFSHEGKRVVMGQRAIQSSTD